MLKDFILIPCHNRCQYTLKCLRNLKALGLFDLCVVVLVDDGSTDGTAQEVNTHYPQVKVLIGSGKLFWTGAMEVGMRYAMMHGAETMVWLNDDSSIPPGVIDRLIRVAKESSGMASALGFVNEHTVGKNWYFPAQYHSWSGLVSKEILPDSGLVPVDACRGNLVAISRIAVEKVGFPDGRSMPHISGDSDYSLRVTRAGLPCLIVTDVQLEEVDTVKTDNVSWLLGEIRLSEVWSKILSRRSSLYPRMKWVYLTRHWGLIGVLQFPLPYLKLIAISILRILIPRTILISMYGKHSHAWKAHSWLRKQ